MFERFPFLEGRYLGYGSYFALLFAVTSVLQALFATCFWAWAKRMDSRITKTFVKRNEEVQFEELLPNPSQPNLLARVCTHDKQRSRWHVAVARCLVAIQSILMFIIASLLSFGGGGEPVLYNTLAAVTWFVVGGAFFYSEKQHQLVLYREGETVARHLILLWVVVALLQLPAWGIVDFFSGTLLAAIPIVVYGLFGYQSLLEETKETMGYMATLECRQACTKKQFPMWKTIAIGVLIALCLVLFVGDSCFSFFNPKMPGISISVITWNSWLVRLFSGPACKKSGNVPCHLYLTLPEDGSTSMFINMHTAWGQYTGTLSVEYWEDGKKPVKPLSQAFEDYSIDWLEENGRRMVHSTFLTGLKPGTMYNFRVPTYEGTHKFTTLSAGNAPVTFLAGGDSGTTNAFLDLLSSGAKARGSGNKTMDFALLGGDISYGNNLPSCYSCWDVWISIYEKTMLRENGAMIPLSMAVGNHDVGSNARSDTFKGVFDPSTKTFWKGTHIPLFFAFFPQHASASNPKIPAPMRERLPYHYHKIGSSMAVFVMDSGHVVTYEEQTTWAEGILKKLPHTIMKFATYHVPIFPSTRKWDSKYDDRRRRHLQTLRRLDETAVGPIEHGLQNWVLPLFDKFHFMAVFENHQHTFKRTVPMVNSKYSETGTVYLGDGNLGIPGDHARVANPLIAKMSGINHAWLVDVNAKMANFSAIQYDGTVFDFLSRPRR